MGRRSRGMFILAGGAAILLILLLFFLPKGGDNRQVVQTPPPTPPPDRVLVAQKFIPEGTVLTSTDMDWANWPKEHIPPGAITNKIRPNARNDFAGYLARSSFAHNEIIQESKLVGRDGGGWVASILPNGQRLVTFNVNPKTASGGFLQPKDKVDIVIVPRGSAASSAGVAILLPQVYVFAINGDTDPAALSAKHQGRVNIPPSSLTVQVSIEHANLLLEVEKDRQLYFNVRPLNEEGGQGIDFDDTRLIPLTVVKFDRTTRVR